MKEYIYGLIPKDSFITRKELVELTGKSDRQVRDYISQIKCEHTIISLSRGKGYRRTKSSDDMTIEEIIEEIETLKHCINEINSRKKVFNKQLRQYIANLKALQKCIDNTNK
jgi:vacuolar-type H+-ATPase subunit I/STV1